MESSIAYEYPVLAFIGSITVMSVAIYGTYLLVKYVRNRWYD